ncbi:MAG: hypothetical protein PHI15_01795 [Methanomicrobium sp.]|nr:hypothetical protein [Methanomicrobium sp.]
MVLIESGDGFIFFGAAAIGLLAGIAGNWFVTSFFMWVKEKSRMNTFFFVIGILMVVFLLVYFLDRFFAFGTLP